MDIHIIQKQNDLKISSPSVKNVVRAFSSSAKVQYDEVTIHFVDTETICDLHAEYFNDPSPTDCISFPMDDINEAGYKMMGDVFVCPQTAVDYVKAHGGDVYQEVTLYVVHGLLHLMGLDDIEEEEIQAMRAAESVHLEHLRKKEIWVHA